LDEISVKAIVVSVSIFVTLLILTLIVLEFTHISDIYANAAESEIAFEDKFDELDKFRDSNNIFTTLDVRNYVKKYATDKTIEVCIESVCYDENTNVDEIPQLNDYETVYNEYTAELVDTKKGYRIVFK